MSQRTLVGLTADSLAAGSAVGFGARMLYDVEVIVSIIAGVLVACSAGLSIYLNWQRHKKHEEEVTLPDHEDK